MMALKVRRDGVKVLVFGNGQPLLSLGYKPALEAMHLLDEQLRNAEQEEPQPLGETGITVAGVSLKFRHEQGHVLVIGNAPGCPTKLLLDLNTSPTEDGGPSIARRVWGAIVAKAKEAEEVTHAPEVIRDAALLHRSGAPFGIATDPKIRAEAAKAAMHDRDLRRFMPNGIKSAEVLPAPTLKQVTRTPAERADRAAARLARDKRIAIAKRIGGIDAN